jgi:hypothetical protein
VIRMFKDASEGYPSLLLACKLPGFIDVGRAVVCKNLITRGYVQIFANKRVSPGGWLDSPRSLLIFDLYIQYSGSRVTNMPA